MRALIEEELARSRSIIAGGDELVPRFRIAAEEGEVIIFVQLPGDLDERMKRMELVTSYMAVKMARSFVMATELQEPDASSAVAVKRGARGRKEVIAGVQMITRRPLGFSETLWMDAEAIGDELPAMLPGEIASVTPAQIIEVEELIRYNEGLRLEPV